MIPIAYIIQWRNTAPWSDDMQIEQDLILSRLLVEIFSDSLLNKELAFRGGTALHKLFFNPAARYSKEGNFIRRDDFIKNIEDKLQHHPFTNDIEPLLSPNLTKTHNTYHINEGWTLYDAADEIKEKILKFLPT